MRRLLPTLLLLALVPAVALAANAPYESNDTAKAAKKVKAGKTVKAAIERIASPANTDTDDVDWFKFTQAKTATIKIRFTSVGTKGQPCFGPVLSAYDAKQKLIKYVQPPTGTAKTLSYKAKRGRNFLLVTPHNVQQCGLPEQYTFKIKKPKKRK